MSVQSGDGILLTMENWMVVKRGSSLLVSKVSERWKLDTITTRLIVIEVGGAERGKSESC
jgi:hypothetical protein